MVREALPSVDAVAEAEQDDMQVIAEVVQVEGMTEDEDVDVVMVVLPHVYLLVFVVKLMT